MPDPKAKKKNKYRVEESEDDPSEAPSSVSAVSSLNEEELHFAQILKESEPLWITNVMIMHPCKFICACYVLLLVFATMTASLGYMMPSLEGTRGRDF